MRGLVHSGVRSTAEIRVARLERVCSWCLAVWWFPPKDSTTKRQILVPRLIASAYCPE
jgi:hypothetical protein